MLCRPGTALLFSDTLSVINSSTYEALHRILIEERKWEYIHNEVTFTVAIYMKQNEDSLQTT